MKKGFSLYAMSKSSNTQQHKASFSAKDIISNLATTPVTAGGKDGYFVKSSSLNSIKEQIHSLESDLSQDATEQITQLRNSLAEALDNNSKMSMRLEDTEKKFSAVESDLKAAKAAHAAKDDELKVFKVKFDADKQESVQSLEEWKAYCTNLESQIRSNSISDPSELQALKDDLRDAKSKVSSANKDLTELNKTLRQKEDALKDSNSRVLSLTADSSALSARLAALNDAHLKSGDVTMPDSVKTMLTTIDLNDTTRKFLGDKAFNWLVKLQSTPAIDVRNTTYNLLLVSRNSANKSVSKLTWLLQKLFDWIKTAALKSKKAVQPWLQSLAKDIASGKVKAISVYREELQKIVTEVNFQKEKKNRATGKEDDAPLNWWDTISTYAYVLVLSRPKSYFKIGVGKISAGIGHIATYAKRFYGWLTRPFTYKQRRADLSKEAEDFSEETNPLLNKVKTPPFSAKSSFLERGKKLFGKPLKPSVSDEPEEGLATGQRSPILFDLADESGKAGPAPRSPGLPLDKGKSVEK